jgi:hypothetical protein
MSKPRIENGPTALAEKYGISVRAAGKIPRSYTSEGRDLLASMSKRLAENRRMHRQDGDYRKRKACEASAD